MAASASAGTIGFPATWSNGTSFIGTLSATRVYGGSWLLEATLAALAVAEPFAGRFRCFFLVGSGAGGSVRPCLTPTPSVVGLSIARPWLT
jgi:hypothetical protein